MRPVYALSFFLFLLLGSSFRLHAANRYWVASGTGNWNSTANWSATSGGPGGATVPGGGDVANFNGSGLGNCTININVSITSIVIGSGYTGTISQGTNTFTTSGAATFGGGTYIGASAAMT